MKTSTLAVVAALFAGVLIGGLVIRYVAYPDQSVAVPSIEWSRGNSNGEKLSPVLFEAFYTKAKSSVELRFDKGVPFIDGEVFDGQDLHAALVKKKEEKKARYLILISDDRERFGAVADRLPGYRRLGFDFVVVMTTRT
jgi:hypothetical protein